MAERTTATVSAGPNIRRPFRPGGTTAQLIDVLPGKNVVSPALSVLFLSNQYPGAAGTGAGKARSPPAGCDVARVHGPTVSWA